MTAGGTGGRSWRSCWATMGGFRRGRGCSGQKGPRDRSRGQACTPETSAETILPMSLRLGTGCRPDPGTEAGQPPRRHSPALRDLNAERSADTLTNVCRKERAAGPRDREGCCRREGPAGPEPSRHSGKGDRQGRRPVPGEAVHGFVSVSTGPFPGSAPSPQRGSGFEELPAAPSPALGTR